MENIIICGGGKIGLGILQYLKDFYNVSLIDNDREVIQKASEAFDIKTTLGHAADPKILEKAGASKADLIIAVTGSDEVNILVVQLAASFFKIGCKVARIRSMHGEKEWESYCSAYLPVDLLISPEQYAVEEVLNYLKVPEAVALFPIADGLAYVVSLTVRVHSPFVDVSLVQFEKLRGSLNVCVMRIERFGKSFVPGTSDCFAEGDIVSFLVDHKHFEAFMKSADAEAQPLQRCLILGASVMSFYLLRAIKKEHPHALCSLIAYKNNELETIVMHEEFDFFQGDALDSSVLEEAGVNVVDAVMATTNDDKINILGSLLAKRYGAKRTIGVTRKESYLSLMTSLGIDKAINVVGLTVRLILGHLRKSYVRSLYYLGQTFPQELLEIDIDGHSYALGMTVEKVNHPREMVVCGVIRAGDLLVNTDKVVLQNGDRVLVLSNQQYESRVKKYFAKVV